MSPYFEAVPMGFETHQQYLYTLVCYHHFEAVPMGFETSIVLSLFGNIATF